MMRPRQAVSVPPRDKTTDKAFVLAVLRAIMQGNKQINEVIAAAGIALDRGLISPGAAINMANGVAPGAFECFLREVEAAEIGTGYVQEAAE